MKKKFKVTLVVFLVVILGCFSETFAATKVNTKLEKNVQISMNKNLLDSAVSNETQLKAIHKYTFDNNSVAKDTGIMAGTNGEYNGTIAGTQLVTENNETFLRFLGVNSNISFKDRIIPLGKKTIKFRIRTTQKKAAYLISNLNDGSTQSGVCIDMANGIMKCGIGVASRSLITSLFSTKAINDGQWHTIVFESSGTLDKDGVRLYVDDMTKPDATATLKKVDRSIAARNLIIGKFALNNNYPFVGDISDLEIYNDMLINDNKCNAISLDKTENSLTVGDTDTIVATVDPDNAANKTIKWTSSDENIVKVDQSGNITAVGKGTATITATTTDGSNLSKSCTVTVNDETSIVLNKTTDLINAGDTDKLTAIVRPSGQAVTWTSSDNSIATVDSNGNVTGIKAGTAIITASTAGGKTAVCTVTVKGQEIEKSKLTLYMNNATTREFYLTQDELDDFINWYTSKSKGEVTLQPYYVFNVSTPGSSSIKKSYVWFMKIESFEVE